MRASSLKTAGRVTKTSAALTVHLGARERQRAFDLATVRHCSIGRLFEDLLDAAETRASVAPRVVALAGVVSNVFLAVLLAA